MHTYIHTVEKPSLLVPYFITTTMEKSFLLNFLSHFLGGIIDSEQLRELNITFSVMWQNPLWFEGGLCIDQNIQGTFSNQMIMLMSEEIAEKLGIRFR